MDYRPSLSLYADKRCFVADCNNPVIGKCSGYKGNCGNFYCDVHSVCAITSGQCAVRGSSECSEIAKDYVATVEKIKAQQPFVAGFIAALLIAAGFSPFYPYSDRSYFWMLFSVLGMPIALYAYMKAKRLKGVIADNENTRPGFRAFYLQYDSLKSRAENARKTSKEVAIEIGEDVAGEVAEEVAERLLKRTWKPIGHFLKEIF